MANAHAMTDSNFETRKNVQAGTITVAVLGLLLLLLLLIGWAAPLPPPPPVDEGIEVNLGSSDMGLGDNQPFEPGKPAPQQQQQQYTPPKAVAEKEEPVKEPMSNDKDADAPEIKKPPVTKVKPDATKIAEKDLAKKTLKKAVVETPPTPVPPKPRAVMKGGNGTGTGGNDADSYKKGGDQGITPGKGDMGKPGGNPNSNNYNGPGGTGTGGMAIVRGDRRIVGGNASFTGDFDENAKIYADIKVSPDGTGQFLRVTKGSTSTSHQYTDMIVQKLRNIKFNSASDESVINVQFIFKVKN